MLSKVSVANKKVYSNVNGSPIKNVLFTGRSSHSRFTNAASDLLPETPEKRFFEPATSTPKSRIAAHGGAPKRARMEDTTSFENYFLKKKDPGWTSPSVKSKAATMESLMTSVSDEKRMVCCPVCQSEVLEAKINEHLDSCL
ncbi:hypothetical protein JD844_024842 [Phrynosoma platyrhinos]|uniref:UBZ4-type domain-containing protein n=1 Tax=Phrynosoma platyrhinos TaxID=52577 RepID=A0ABQ7SYZ9_PHRPL|nr:hypothetical protein JD844_024842 [Phrynosoma platyrhinos]